MIDTSRYDGHTNTYWCARNVRDGSPESCDEDYEHDEPFIETDQGNVGIGYMIGGRDIHPLEEKRANMRLMADAHLLLAELKETRECLWWCYDLKRFGNEIKDEHWDFIGRLLGADTDHNDNEWREEE